MKTSDQNLSVLAYERIKHMILSGELQQGQAISINAMTETLQISRTPITNACQRLEYERLLTILPKQGVVINTISLETACGIYELRAAIESHNAKRILDQLTQQDVDALQASVDKQAQYAKEGNCLAFMDEDTFFHRYLLDKSVNYELLSVINQLYDRAYIIGTKNIHGSRMEQSLNEHRKILEAIKAMDRQGFADAIEDNILSGFRNLTASHLGPYR